MAQCVGDRQADHLDRLASSCVRSILALEIGTTRMATWRGAIIDSSDQVFLIKFSELCLLTNNPTRLADPFPPLGHQLLVAYIMSTDGQERHEPPTMLLRTTRIYRPTSVSRRGLLTGE